MSSSFHYYKKKRVRFDKFHIFDLDGNEVGSLDLFDHLKLLVSKSEMVASLPLVIEGEAKKKLPQDVSTEFSHANSFYQIGENILGQKDSRFAKGNYLINVNGLGLIIIVDQKFKIILWIGLQKSIALHDVQMLPDGFFLVYDNYTSRDKIPHTTLAKMHPLTGEYQVLYRANPVTSFFSPKCGGVQILPNNHLLFSDITDGGYAREVDENGKEVWKQAHVRINTATQKPDLFQQVKRQDFSEFLKNNKPL